MTKKKEIEIENWLKGKEFDNYSIAYITGFLYAKGMIVSSFIVNESGKNKWAEFLNWYERT